MQHSHDDKETCQSDQSELRVKDFWEHLAGDWPLRVIAVDVHPDVVKECNHSKDDIFIVSKEHRCLEHYYDHCSNAGVLVILIEFLDVVHYLHELEKVEDHKVCDPAIKHRKSHMNGQKLFEGNIVTAIIEVLDLPVAEVVDENYKNWVKMGK